MNETSIISASFAGVSSSSSCGVVVVVVGWECSWWNDEV